MCLEVGKVYAPVIAGLAGGCGVGTLGFLLPVPLISRIIFVPVVP